ncbi:MAG: hypothetical protein GX621_14220 [Pirellulaceae bacterium]|nr:hypothetical protein [Pirellulaceae bacterium]
MKLRAWLAVGLFSASWLPGLGYYAPASVILWALLVLVGVVLLFGQGPALPSRRVGAMSLVLLLPAIWFIPWPAKMALILLAMGAGLAAAPLPRRWPGEAASTCLVSGTVLLAQSAAMHGYEVVTSRCHDLPGPLATVFGLVTRLFGFDLATSGSTWAVKGTTTVYPLGATWDLLLPPTLVCFVVGGIVLLGFATVGQSHARRVWLRASGFLLLIAVAWMPVRLALVLSLYLQRAAHEETSIPSCAMNQWLVWWLPAVLLGVPVLLSWWWIKMGGDSDETAASSDSDEAEPTARRRWTILLLAAAGAAMLAFVWAWDPVGSPKQGRVRVVERRSRWEPTDAPYDTESYGEGASYTYRLIYDYASHYFTMSRVERSTPITGESLADCDVLVLKTPTEPWSPEEIEAIERFVKHGGGLLMIGDHTNVFKSSTYLNDVARQLGFTYRNDLLFHVGDPYEQPYRAAAVVHPAVAHVDKLDLAVSCSIDPGLNWGRAAMTGRGLWNLQADYQTSNYHPPAEYRPEMRVGPFVQLWATRYEKGRVLAFTDSTIFSNFCTFQPGKAELMLNMLGWLNHRSFWDERLHWLLLVVPVGVVGLILLTVAAFAGRKMQGGWLFVLAAGLFGAAACCWTVTAVARVAMPYPAEIRQPSRFTIDRNVSDVPLSKGAYIQGDGEGFGLFEQWIPRLDHFTARREGDDVFSGEALVVIRPTGSVSETYRDRMVEYVRDGGHLLVLESPDNYASTANDLLWPFGLSVGIGQSVTGPLNLSGRPTRLDRVDAAVVRGGTPLADIAGTTVAATVAHGEGTVTAVGFASAFDDEAMGRECLSEPDEALRQRYEVLFEVLRSVAPSGPISPDDTPR